MRGVGGTRYAATFDHRSSSGFVSLRLVAADQQGNTLEQEITRAFALR